MMRKDQTLTIVINITADGSEKSTALINQYIKPIIAEHRVGMFGQENLYTMIDQKFDLSNRESEVLKGMIAGLKNIEIAEKLFISVSTVKYHSKKIFEKLNISTRNQAFSRIQNYLNVV